MTEEMFKKLISELEYKDGGIYHGGTRLWLASISWIAGLQRRMTDTLGPMGSFAIINDASMEGGKILGKQLAEKMKGATPEDVVKAYFAMAQSRGMGLFTVTEFQVDPTKIVVRYDNSYITGVIKDAEDGQCYMTSGFATIIEAIFEAHGISKKLKQEEPKCIAKGDAHCEFLILDEEF